MAEIVRVGMSLAEFEVRFAEQPFELINGEIRDMAATKRQHSEASKRIYDRILYYLVEHNVAEVYLETTYILEDVSDWVKGSRVPDIMVYEKSRYETYAAENPLSDDDKPFVLVPDFVVEIISPTDKYTDVLEKIDAYLSDGVALIWIVEPKQKTVAVYAGSDTPTTMRSGATLTGGEVLLDFSLKLDEVFR